MKRSLKSFFRSFYITFIILLCITLGSIGIIKSYEAIRLTSFGEYKSFFEKEDDYIRIFDFTFKI